MSADEQPAGRPHRVEVALRAAVFGLGLVGLVGLAVTLGATVHPVVGWLVPAVVGGALSVWFGARWLDELTVRNDLARIESARPRGEPLTLPAGFDPDR